MKAPRAFGRVVVFVVLLWIVAQFPIFPQVAEMRSYSSDGESLSVEYSIGPLTEFIENFRFIRVAWTTPPKVIYAALAVFNAACALLVCWLGARSFDRIFEKWKPSNRRPN